MTQFETLELLPDDPILGLIPVFEADPSADKINLTVGSYKDADGHPMVLNCVSKAEQNILGQHLNKEYQPIDGDPIFRNETLKLIFGGSSSFARSNFVYAAQCVGASGALSVAGELLAQMGIEGIALSHPTWSNHRSLLGRAGLKVSEYTYYDAHNHSIDFVGLQESLRNMPKNSAVLLHCCCHNPTGIDPSEEQWRGISELIMERGIFPVFDFAYQGFKDDVEKDALPIRIFADAGQEMLVAYSFSKNFGLYGERVGALCSVSHDPEVTEKIKSNVKRIIRANYSSPPLQGGRIVKTVLTTPELKSEWLEELGNMRMRIHETRKNLVAKLCAKSGNADFSYIKDQCGMFSFLGLTQDQVLKLRRDHSVYLCNNGRLSVAGLNDHNIDYFTDAFLTVLAND